MFITSIYRLQVYRLCDMKLYFVYNFNERLCSWHCYMEFGKEDARKFIYTQTHTYLYL